MAAFPPILEALFITQFDVVRTPIDLIGIGAYDALPDCPMGTSCDLRTLRCIKRFLILLVR